MTTPTIKFLASVDMTSGLNEDLHGFVKVRALSEDGTTSLLGQLTPDEARQLALSYLEVAESAEHDAMVARQLLRLNDDRDQALTFVAYLRSERERGR